MKEAIHRKCPEQGHQQRQKTRAGSGSEEKAGGRVATKAFRVSLRGDERSKIDGGNGCTYLPIG